MIRAISGVFQASRTFFVPEYLTERAADFDLFNLHKQKSISHPSLGFQSAPSNISDCSHGLDLSDSSGIPLAGPRRYLCGGGGAYHYQPASVVAAT